jgi:hypothetical protein
MLRYNSRGLCRRETPQIIAPNKFVILSEADPEHCEGGAQSKDLQFPHHREGARLERCHIPRLGHGTGRTEVRPRVEAWGFSPTKRATHEKAFRPGLFGPLQIIAPNKFVILSEADPEHCEGGAQSKDLQFPHHREGAHLQPRRPKEIVINIDSHHTTEMENMKIRSKATHPRRQLQRFGRRPSPDRLYFID